MTSKGKSQFKNINDDLFGGSVSSDSGNPVKASPNQDTPSSRKFIKREISPVAPVKKKDYDDEEENDGSEIHEDEDNSDENCEEGQTLMDTAINDIYEKVEDGRLSISQAQFIMSYVEQKMKEGLPESFVISMISRPNFLLMLHSTNENVCSSSSTQPQQLPESNVTRNAKESDCERDNVINDDKMNKSLSTTEAEWLKFRDEYESEMILDKVEREIWNSELRAKIKLIENLQKEVTEQMSHKKFSKYKEGDVYQRWLKGIKTEILPIPFCEMRIEHGPLCNPRRKPDPRSNIFQDVTGVFDSKSYESALILYNLLDALTVKISSFLYSTITYCMSENADALRVINAEKDKDYFSLLNKLSARFKVSSEVERERLVDELNAARRQSNETIRAFYGRLSAIATELRTIFDRPIQDEDIKRLLLKELSEASKNNFLHLEMMPKYAKNFNDLCLEVIKRDEILQKAIEKNVVANNVNYDDVTQDNRYSDGRFQNGRIQGGREQVRRSTAICHRCRKPGHIARECKSRTNEKEDERNYDATTMAPRNVKKYGKFSYRAHGRRRNREHDDEANQVSSSGSPSEISNVQCYYCHERGTHASAACPNSTVNVAMLNNNYKVNEADRMNPHKTFRIA